MTASTFYSGWDFVMGLGKAHLHVNLEVAIFSRCKSIKDEHQILGSSTSPGPRPLFCGCNFMMGLGKRKLHTVTFLNVVLVKFLDVSIHVCLVTVDGFW